MGTSKFHRYIIQPSNDKTIFETIETRLREISLQQKISELACQLSLTIPIVTAKKCK